MINATGRLSSMQLHPLAQRYIEVNTGGAGVVTTLWVCVPLLLIEWEGTGYESRGLGGLFMRLHELF